MSEIVLIAAVAANGVIGRGNDLVFRHPADARHFRELTMGFPVLMGRKTWESLPVRFRPLPGRRNIVVTRQRDYPAAGAETVRSLNEALSLTASATTVFVIGGGEIYAQAMPLSQRMELTEIGTAIEGDVHFPARADREWIEVHRERPVLDHPSLPPFEFVRYQRAETASLV